MSKEQRINFTATYFVLILFLFLPLSLWNLSWLEGFLYSVLIATLNGFILLGRVKLGL